MNNGTKLSEHSFKKGKFITPINAAIGDILKLTSWHKDALPELIWLGCVLETKERIDALKCAVEILEKLKKLQPDMELPVFSKILSMPENTQNEFFEFICKFCGKNVFVPLTILYSNSDYPIFSNYFCNSDIGMKTRQKMLSKLLEKTYDSQSDLTTDIKYLVLVYFLKKGKLYIPPNMIDKIKRYPILMHENEEMRSIRPMIRSTYGTLGTMFGSDGEKPVYDQNFINDFWQRVSVISECKLIYIQFEEEEANMKEYIEYLEEILRYLAEYLKAFEPISEKAHVLIGIVTYSYKRFRELYDYNMCNSICARSIVRVLLENLVMIKYLLKSESQKPDIWYAFQEYGMGIYKGVVARARDYDKEFPYSHIDLEYLRILVNSIKNENFLNIDTSYFDKQGVREKSDFVGEKELWGRFYDYESSYEHGLWGSIVESSMLICDNPSHQFHFMPDVTNQQKLKSVWSDAVLIMNKTLNFIDSVYPIPEKLLLKVNEYEKQLFQR